ncbi:hypothetical protein TcCL_ESM10428 [Trypanosoma cruzi]|nr:hypothetical protein TcCL_ESM10428 [Trypanosoma cruzi]
MRDGLPVMWHEASNRRLAHSSSIPYNAPIDCELHGHMQTVHILVEPQHARWGFFESLQYCESFFFWMCHRQRARQPWPSWLYFSRDKAVEYLGPVCGTLLYPAVCTVASLTTFLTHLCHREREGWLRIPFICGRNSAVLRAISSTRIFEGTRHLSGRQQRHRIIRCDTLAPLLLSSR